MQTALKRFRGWFVPPVFPDDGDKTRNARVLYTLLTSVLILMVPATLDMIFIVVQKKGVSIILLFLLVTVLASHTLVHQGRVRAAGKLFVIVMWLLFTLLYVFGGRTASAATNLILAVVVISGLLLGKRFTIILAILSSLVGLGMAILENAGYPLAHFFPGPPIPSWVTWTLAIFLTLTPLNLTLQSISQSAETLRESEERLSYVLEGGQLGYWDWNIETGRVQRNARWAEMLGYTLDEIEATVKQWTDLHHPDDRDLTWQSIQNHLEGRTKEHKVEYRMRTKDGRYRWILDQAKIVKRDSRGEPLRMSGTHTDITERKLAEGKEREQRILAEAISNSAAALNGTLEFDDVMDRILDNVGRVVPHDAANIMLLGADGDTLSVACHRGYLERGVKDDELKRKFSLTTMPILVETARTGRSVATPDTRSDPAWTPYPATQWVHSYLTVPIRIRRTTVGFLNLDSETIDFFNSNHAERLQVFVNHAAIAIENAHLYEEVRKLAITDVLTGVYNRSFFETELARMELGRDFPISIVVADLDNMKTTNDELGHTAGDDLLKHTGQILKEIFRASDIIARVGGDEFAILLPKTVSSTTKQMLSRVREKLDEYNTANPNLLIQLSLGASTAENGRLMDAFIAADKRMYADKAKRKSSK